MAPASHLQERVRAARRHLEAVLGDPPRVAIVLGSGLHTLTDGLQDRIVCGYDQIPHWPVTTVAGHPGQVLAGAVAGRRVLVLAGRTHLYEGGSPDQATFAVRVLAALGVRTVVLTNAAGGIREDLVAGRLMLIEDHLNATGLNPLVGPNDPGLGPRFPDMTEVYSRRLRSLAEAAAADAGLALSRGVYVGVLGPSYETPAEIRAFARLGGDAVGMSTVHEAIVARYLGLEVMGVSCIANPAAGRQSTPLSEAEVLTATGRAAGDVWRLLEGVLARL